MADNERSSSSNKSNVGPMIAGLAAGAALGAMAGAALSDKETKKKLRKAADEVKVKGQETFHQISNKVKEIGEEANKRLEKAKEGA